MADKYICLEDAVDALKALEEPAPTAQYLSAIFDCEDTIESIKLADAILVVRCKDCKLRNINGYCTKFQNNISGIATSWFMPNDDGFCSFGKCRKEEDNG